MEQEQQIIFTDEEGNEISFTVLAETVLQGRTYLLVTGDVSDKAEIMCEILVRVGENGNDWSYEYVEDEEESENIFRVFEALLSEEDMEV